MSDTFTMKLCPHCRGANRADAEVCARCHRWFNKEYPDTIFTDTSHTDPTLIRPTLQVQSFGISFKINGYPLMLDIADQDRILLGREAKSILGAHFIDLSAFRASEFGVSRQHAMLTYQQRQFRISDLGSLNGTSVNDKKLSPNNFFPIHDGDKIALGFLVMTVRINIARGTTPLTPPQS